MTEMMKKKLEGKKGFTLVELLIVVAIIAILVAVSIPVYSNYTENVAKGVDQANERDAVGLATTAALTSDATSLTWTGGEAGAPGATGTGFYKVENNKGTLVSSASGLAAYGKCKDHGECIVKVTVTNGAATTEWVKPGAVSNPVGSSHL